MQSLGCLHYLRQENASASSTMGAVQWKSEWNGVTVPFFRPSLELRGRCKSLFIRASGCQSEHKKQLWEEYFAHPTQWWDNRTTKVNPRYPDFVHRLTREALWVDSWSNPPWVKSKLLAKDKTEFPVGIEVKASNGKSGSGRSVLHNDRIWKKTSHINRTEEENREVHNFQSNVTHEPMKLLNKNSTLALLRRFDDQGIPLDSYTYVKILEAISRMKDLTLGKHVHDHIYRSGMKLNMYISNCLLKMYIMCSSMSDALRLFDGLSKKDVITWNILLGGYAQNNCGQEAYEAFLEMQREGVKPDAITYMNILKSFTGRTALQSGKEVHALIRTAGLESDVRVGTALIKMYGKCGCIRSARHVFQRLPTRNLISWNVMIGAYAENGCGDEAFKLFLQMKGSLKPDAFTILSILNPHATKGALSWVKEVHAQAWKVGLENDVRVGNALVNMYAKSGSIDNARQVFDRMINRDIISWNVMLGAYAKSGHGREAYELFCQMKTDGPKPDAATFLNILGTDTSSEALEWMRNVHAHASEVGLDRDLRVGSALLHTYAKFGNIEDARQIFDGMVNRDVVSWNVMIAAYADRGNGSVAYILFKDMKRTGLEPDAATYLGILNANSASVEASGWVKEVHTQAVGAGLHSDVRVGTALVNMLAQCDNVEEARQVFDKIINKNVISWSVMIRVYSEIGRGDEAYKALLRMQQEGLKPDAFTYAMILNPAASAGGLDWVKLVHAQVLEAGLESDMRVANALVTMYARSGSIEDARLVFDRTRNRDVISWTVMIGGLALHGYGQEALQLFERMRKEGVQPDAVTLVEVLSACSHAGLVDEGRRLFSSLSEDYGIVPEIEHYNCMVDILGRAGLFVEAEKFIKNMPVKANGATWRALLGACRSYGNVDMAKHAAEECLKLEPHSAPVYVLLSNVFATAGLWDEVASVRNMIKERGVKKEPGQSWIEFDNKIHNFVVEDMSHPEAEQVHAEKDRLINMIKAIGYVPDTKLVTRDIDEQQKEVSLCSHSEKLAIAFGFLHVPPEKKIRIFKNLRVCKDCHTATKLISKVTGRDIIARDANRFHHFKDGVCSCGDYW